MKRQIEDILSQRLSQNHPLIQVLIGPRQVGKTTAAKSICQSFGGTHLFASADSPTPLSAEWLEARWLQARSMTQPTLLVIDEVQKVPGWSEVVKRLFDQDRGVRDLRVLLLGSASIALQTGIRESLAGRFELLRAYHWNLEESTQAFGWDLDTFLKYGGYPDATRFIDSKERWQSYIKDSIIEPVLGRDILASVSIAKPVLFRQAFEIALHYPAQEISYQKIVGQLQEKGSIQTVKHYFEILEGAFLLTQLFKYSTRTLSTRESSPKLIIPAPALTHAFVDPDRVVVDRDWRGRIFESAIGAALTRTSGKLYYWREKNQEVDFILETSEKLFAIEVKSGRRVQQSGIDAFLRRFPRAKPIVITPNNCSELLSDKNAIDVLMALSE
jgi:uncharacterized protein